MDWIELSVQVDRESVEAVADAFHRFGRGGVAIEEVGALGGKGAVEPAGDGPLLVKAYFPLDDDVDEKRQGLAQALRFLSMIRPLAPLQERRVAEQDWAEAWKEHFHVHRPGERTVVVPTWREYTPAPEEIILLLDPGMAFGTGLHPTTRLCVREMERRVRAGMAVLDLGTGSGILAILAAKMGAGRVLALDTDSVAVEVAQENVEANGVGLQVEVEMGSLPLAAQDPLNLEWARWSASAFDLVVANLTADVIAELAPAIVGALRPGATALCSGIIAEGFPHAVEALLAAGARLVDALSDGDWRAVVVERPSRP